MAWLVYSHRGVAKRLVLDIEPAGAATAEPFATQPVGHLVDGSGLPSRTAGVTVTASKVTGSGTLGGTLTAVTDDEGIFAFSDIELDTVTTGVTLQFTAGGLVAVTSAAFDVTAGSGTAYALTAEATSYAWSGAAATLRWGRSVVAAPVAYTWTPAAATLRWGRRLTAEGASYAWTPAAATLTYTQLAFRLAPSSFIAAGGGTATTARLTAPAGKTSGADFQAGRQSDDTNPLATLDLGSGKYTELEWAVMATEAVAVDDVYEFRVVADDAALDSYSVTPSWTVSSAEGTYSIGASAATYNWTVASSGLTYSGVATQLVVTTQPAGAVTGVAFTTQPVVRLRNASGNNVSEAGVTVTAYLSGGSGTLGGTVQVATDSSGIATFTDLSITGTGDHTVSFHALMSTTQSIWSDDAETDKSASYFEVNTNGGNFARASVDGSMQWRAICSGAGPEFGNLKLGIGRTPSGVTSVGPSGVDFGLVTMECDIYHSVNNLTDDQDKCLRMSVFSAGDWSQAACVHIWSEGHTYLEIDPVTSVVNNVPTAVGWNDFAHFTWTGLTAGTNPIFGAAATTQRRIKVEWRLNDPGQSNGTIRYYVNDVLDAQQTGLNLVQSYTGYGINAVHWENYRTGGVSTANNRMYDNLAVSGQARAVVAANSVTVSAAGGDPVPSGLIVYDTRAGGANDWQVKTTLAGLESEFDADINSNLSAFQTDCDGAGTNGRQTDWIASQGTEQSAIMNKYFSGGVAPNSATRGMYFQWKSKYLSGYAYNSNGQGIKLWLGLRQADNGTDRLYYVENNTGGNIQCDNRNYSSAGYSTSPVIGSVVTTTLFLNGTGGIVKIWRNGTLVLNLSGQDIGSGGFAQDQRLVAAFVPAVCTRYDWDYVAWVPPA